VYLGSDTAAESLSRLTDWAMRNLDPSVTASPYEAPHGTEWYTLSENLYRAFLATGDEKYCAFAKTWEYPQNWDRYLDPASFASVKKHAYSHVNTLSGAAMAYRVHGDERYLKIITNAYDVLTGRYLFATGGYGPSERLFGDSGYLGDSILHTLDDGWGHMEVSCSSWAVFKLCRYLAEFTGEARYGDWAEKVLYNCMAAELRPRDGGKIMYYADYYVLGARKTCDDGRVTSGGATFEWPCCTGTYPQAVAEYVNLASLFDREGIYISQYMPARHTWLQSGREVTMNVTTDYAGSGECRIEVEVESPVHFTVSLRQPRWARPMDLTVNGKPIPGKVSGGWVRIDRTWNFGDIIDIHLPFELRFQPVDAEHQGLVALLYGPVVLASDSSGIMTGPISNPSEWIRPTGNGTLEYGTDEGHLKVYPKRRKFFKPYYAFTEGETYFLYNRIEAGQDDGQVQV
jgi:uncharacterized protein